MPRQCSASLGWLIEEGRVGAREPGGLMELNGGGERPEVSNFLLSSVLKEECSRGLSLCSLGAVTLALGWDRVCDTGY